MINLIPPQGIRSARREYLLRTASVCCMLLGSVILLLTVAHIPTYALIDAQMVALESTARKEAGRGDAVRALETDVERAELIIKQLKRTKALPREIDIVAEIQSHASGDIQLTAFTIDVSGQKSDLVQVSGVAATREALAGFKTALETSSFFEKADIPISSLVRDTDLPFTITLTLISQTPV